MSLFTPQKTAPRTSHGSPLTPRNLNLQGSRRPSPKSTIRGQPTPFKLDRVTSDWTLTGTGTPKRAKKTFRSGDRFIARANTATAKTRPHSSSSSSESFNDLEYSSQVAEACGLAINQRILAFQPEAPESKHPVLLTSQYNRPLRPVNTQTVKRRINTVPERVLDAPGLIDDYYLNLLDWSSSNCVAIALERSVYVWNAETGTVNSLLECDDSSYIASLKWAPDGTHIGVGLSDGTMAIYDSETGQKMRSLLGHQARVSALSWSNHLMTSGARNGYIYNSDVRIQHHHVSSFTSHAGEICGLSWKQDGTQLASGGNDNLVKIFDARSQLPKFTKSNHSAAVKALAWCPWSNVLATGGGSSDRYIHMFNTTTGSRLSSFQGEAQVTSLTWAQHNKEIVSTSGNQLSVFGYAAQTGLSKIVDIPAHESRILCSSISPDGSSLATVSSDECLKFWKVFEAKPRQREVERPGVKAMSMTIR